MIQNFQDLQDFDQQFLSNQKVGNLFVIFFAFCISFLCVGCQNPDGGNKEAKQRERIILQAEENLKRILQEQETNFPKEKIISLIVNKVGQEPSLTDWVFGYPTTCYGYYSSPGDINNNVVDSVYYYAFQDACKGQWGFRLELYVGAVFAVPIPGSKQLKTISILCKENQFAYVSRKNLSPPKYKNGLLSCPPKTHQVYFHDSSSSAK
ncbi:hypothetical protein NIES21_47990 [Anabaenopsis circularis NIES-21]|uniref:Uncharacterized protein n=1 Tax=Anabaenopsis circularis NIES-21 TaxID=1085406 RepID=A0A1Z4GN46_9CYAN|nr:hypothetical protein NIES21_47990 [Anabaenopsis circularis NIES-21]